MAGSLCNPVISSYRKLESRSRIGGACSLLVRGAKEIGGVGFLLVRGAKAITQMDSHWPEAQDLIFPVAIGATKSYK